MKKNKMMRLASILLVCVLLTTSVISGTFAKYVTTDSASDTARVAKWGVVASINGNLFGATYDQSEEIISHNSIAASVSSSNANELVVAPGTNNDDALTLSVSGNPEVSTKVTYDAAEDTSGKNYANCEISLAAGTYGVMVPYVGDKTTETNDTYYIYENNKYTLAQDTDLDKEWYELHDVVTVADGGYRPLVWSWSTNVDGTASGETSGTFAEMQTAIADTFPATMGFAPNSFVNTSITIGWKWDFGDEWADQAGDDDEIIRNEDKYDTILGNMMAYFGDDTAVNKVIAKAANGDYVNVSYNTVEVDANSANEKKIVLVDGTEIACLTVAFNARLTVEQVD